MKFNWNDFFLLLLSIGFCSVCTNAGHVNPIESDIGLEPQVKFPPLTLRPISPCRGKCMHGECIDSTCSCDFGYWGDYCDENYMLLYQVYVYVFSVLFGFVALISLIQLIRSLYIHGCKMETQKIMLFMFIVQGVERLIWLQLDPHNLKGVLNPILENILYGVGLYIIVFCYVLVVMLWAMVYKKASLGEINSWVLRNIKPIFVCLLIFMASGEIVLRVFWRLVNTKSGAYMLIVSMYYLFVLFTILVISLNFLFYGIRMYKNLTAFKHVNELAQGKLRRITSLTAGVTALSLVSVMMLVASFTIEFKFFHFQNMISFMVEQYAYRSMEICLCGLILFFLRSYQPQRRGSLFNKQDEKKPLISNV